MWVKSLDENDWVNMVHITNFSIEETGLRLDCKTYEVYAFLDASRKIFNPFNPSSNLQEPAFIIVCRGTYIECEEFVKERIYLQTAYQWVGYIVGRLYCCRRNWSCAHTHLSILSKRQSPIVSILCCLRRTVNPDCVILGGL